jgi:hypothetical protein
LGLGPQLGTVPEILDYFKKWNEGELFVLKPVTTKKFLPCVRIILGMTMALELE